MKKRIVVKIGTSTLLGNNDQPGSGFEVTAASIGKLIGEYDVVLITSGAIGFGVRQLAMVGRPKEVSALQALSAIGQVGLMRHWHEAFSQNPVGQVLLTARELNQEDSLSILLHTLESLWELGVVPIVNENDAITNSEITFGDNDKLAALVAVNIGAQKLILLTDQNGIQENFGTDQESRIQKVSIIDAKRHIVISDTNHGTGGMQSKLIAAQIALDHGVEVYIAHGAEEGSVESVLAGKSGTKIVQ